MDVPVETAIEVDGSIDASGPEKPALTNATMALMSFSVAAIVGNIYYIQPLLADVAHTFGMTIPQVGAVAMLAQAGTALGMLVFVPLGDTHERRRLISRLLLFACAALALTASARNSYWLAAASFTVGIFGATVHLIVPYAAHLAPPKQRGRVLGVVFSGLLMGILLARTFSGFVGAQFGWRWVYWCAAAMMLSLSVLIRLRLPPSEPTVSLTWPKLIRSVWDLAREHGELREASFMGAALFCAFSMFWTTLVFFLETPPYHYGDRTAGIFGLVGAAGAAGAPVIGRLADRYGARRAAIGSFLLTIASFLVLGGAGHWMIGLVAGVILLDLGVQSGHVANQTRIYALAPDARSRLNTFYMVTYFVGGALGSSLGTLAWRYSGWRGVCTAAFAVLCLALVAAPLLGRNAFSTSRALATPES